MPSTHNVPTNPSLSSAQRGDGFKDLAYAALVVPSLVAISRGTVWCQAGLWSTNTIQACGRQGKLAGDREQNRHKLPSRQPQSESYLVSDSQRSKKYNPPFAGLTGLCLPRGHGANAT
ncbi:hypothetical protein MCOR02_008715 [Pyricularia oryzae]|nr:hypothetical protein MCOR02_008715 [Pyricularia oryzae]